MRPITGIVILAAILSLGGGTAALAQSAYQTVSNPAGYQFQVPSDWVAGTVSDPTETYMVSPTVSEVAYVVVRAPDGATAADRLKTLTQQALMPADSQSSYVVTNPSSPVQVAGADTADGGAATFVDQNGTASQEYIIAAIKGMTGYVLVVDVPLSVDVATPSLAQTILGSFKLAPAATAAAISAASPASAASGATTAPASIAAAPAASAGASAVPAPMPIYASDFGTGDSGWAPLKGSESVSIDATREMTAGNPSLRVTTPGRDVSEGAVVNSGSVDAGTVYTVNLWVFAPTGTTLQLALGVSGVGVYAQDTFTGTGGWQEITLAGTSQASGQNQIQVKTSDSPQATTFWVSSAEVDPGLAGR